MIRIIMMRTMLFCIIVGIFGIFSEYFFFSVQIWRYKSRCCENDNEKLNFTFHCLTLFWKINRHVIMTTQIYRQYNINNSIRWFVKILKPKILLDKSRIICHWDCLNVNKYINIFVSFFVKKQIENRFLFKERVRLKIV